MPIESLVIMICVALAALAFVVLAVFVVILCCSLIRTNRQVKSKMHMIDPYSRIVEWIGYAIERRMHSIHQLSCDVEDCEECACEAEEAGEGINKALEIAEWALLGMAIFKKLKRR